MPTLQENMAKALASRILWNLYVHMIGEYVKKYSFVCLGYLLVSEIREPNFAD